jgi:signal transduction histidine kinase
MGEGMGSDSAAAGSAPSEDLAGARCVRRNHPINPLESDDRQPIWARFAARQGELLFEYRTRLVAAGSPLVADPETARGCLDHAAVIIGECVRSLREGVVVVSDDAWVLASEIGARRAAGNVHPVESLRAGAVLVELVILALNEVTEGAAPFLLPALLTLNQSVAGRMHLASLAYDRFLFEQIKHAQADRSRTMAREVHDHVGNGVSLAHRQLELYDVLRAHDGAGAHLKVVQARRVLTETLDTTRRLVSGLRAPDPRTGLREALQMFVATVDSDRTEVDVVVDGDERWFSHEVAGELFAVLREGLRNAFKHADPSRIDVRVRVTPWQVNARVEDDGTGFEPRQHGAGNGLAAMTERASMLGGTLCVTSIPGAGTRLEFTVPLMGEQHDRGA